jgi:hypothetical protein
MRAVIDIPSKVERGFFKYPGLRDTITLIVTDESGKVGQIKVWN